MRIKYKVIATSESTNKEIRGIYENSAQEASSSERVIRVLRADVQTNGEGQRGTHWESAAGENLLMSFIAPIDGLSVSNRFVFSAAMALAVYDSVVEVLPEEEKNLAVKWPNDVYWQNRKLCGMTITNEISGTQVREVLVGIGLNIHQKHFVSDAPNPVSLSQISPHTALPSPDEMMRRLMTHVAHYIHLVEQEREHASILTRYRNRLFWRDGLHAFRSIGNNRMFPNDTEEFEARIIGIDSSGRLLLEDTEGRHRTYDIKEVAHVIGTPAPLPQPTKPHR